MHLNAFFEKGSVGFTRLSNGSTAREHARTHTQIKSPWPRRFEEQKTILVRAWFGNRDLPARTLVATTKTFGISDYL